MRLEKKEKNQRRPRLITYLKDRHNYSMEVNMLFLVHSSMVFLFLVSFAGTSLLNAYPDARILWIVGILFSIINMEICLIESYYEFSKKMTSMVFAYLFVPLGLYYSKSIVTPSILYSYLALLMVNIISTGRMRWIYSSSIVTMVVIFAFLELQGDNASDSLLISDQIYILWICFFTVIALITTLLLQVITSYLVKYNNEIRKKNSDLHTISIMDALTSLFNKRYFDDCISQVLNSHKLVGDSVALLLIDIDNFKQYNDFYGHYEGDNCLKLLAHVFRLSLYRKTDMVFRIGGDEFAVLLLNVKEREVDYIAKRIHDELANQQLEHCQSTVSKYVTLSIGATVVSGSIAYSSEEIIKKADAALYKSKGKGRNCTTVSSF